MRMDRGVQGLAARHAPLSLIRLRIAGSIRLHQEAPGEVPPTSSTLFQCRAIRYPWIARHFCCADRLFPGCLQSDHMASESLPQLTDSTCGSGLTSVPVFNCVAILSPIPGGTKLAGRIANLAGISGEGNTERDVLIQLTKRFKAAVQEYSQKQQPIPWIDPPETPGSGEMQRFIPVHL